MLIIYYSLGLGFPSGTFLSISIHKCVFLISVPHYYTHNTYDPLSVYMSNPNTILRSTVKNKSIRLQAWKGPESCRRLRLPRFRDNRYMKVVRLSALRTGRLYPSKNIPDTHFCQGLSRLQGHTAAGRIISKKNSNDTIGNRTRDLPACSAVLRSNNTVLF